MGSCCGSSNVKYNYNGTE